MKKKVDFRLIVSGLVISAILFCGGLFTGYALSKERLTGIEGDMKSIVRDVENFQLQFLFFDVLGENATCPLLSATLSEINKNSYEIGSKLTSYGTTNDFYSETEYVSLKTEYSRLLISYWLLANKLKSSCSMNATTILYFYSKNCKSCDDQGFVLSYIKNRFGDRVLVFALDSSLEEPSVHALKEYYNISSDVDPALVIDGKLYQSFYTEKDLEGIIGL